MESSNSTSDPGETCITTLCWVANPFFPVVDQVCITCGKLDSPLLPSFMDCLCGAKFCSEQCCQQAQSHRRLCVGPHTEAHPTYKYKLLALETQHPTLFSTLQLAADMACRCLEDTIVMNSFHTEERSIGIIDSLEELVKPSHELIVEILAEQNVGWQQASPTLKEWSNLLYQIHIQSVTGTLQSNYAKTCEQLRGAATASMDAEFLSQAAEGASLVELLDEPEQCFPPMHWTAFLQKKTPVVHSCMPSHKIIGADLRQLRITSIDETNINDICDSSTVSLVDHSLDLEERTEELDEKGIICDCTRCVFERDPSAASAKDVQHFCSMLELAKSHMRYDDAMNLVEAWVRLVPEDPVGLLSRARIAGWQGDFIRREQLLLDAGALVQGDDAINAAVSEVLAYYRKEGGDVISVGTWGTIEGLEGDAFQDEGILDAEDCLRMVKIAEKHQQDSRNGEWTTERHYAVPTTDIPVYQIPELLAWFNEQLETRIFPAVSEQFEVSGRLRIFDAFLVKYDASAGQKRLPLHNDQSEFSLTIAMNSLDSYNDGGTYFLDIDETCKTDTGGIISFRGDLLHAGKAITVGTRYIIVCFIYQE